MSALLAKMTGTPTLSIYEKAFAKSDKTDAILVVQGRKLHVNKAVLSYHSEYFYELFNSDFQEKSMNEIEIKDVNFVDFAAVLSLVHNASLIAYCSEKYLDLADRFQLPAAKRHLEQFLISSDQNRLELISIAEKYRLNDLMAIAFSKIDRKDYYKKEKTNLPHFVPKKPEVELLDQLSEETNIKLFHHYLEISCKISNPPIRETTKLSIYESTFGKSDKTDAILVVDGKKLHVNKAVLSYHSDYFNVLFNSDFKEKTMGEIEIKEVNFKNFVTLLSIIHSNPIALTNKQNAMNIVELSDRFIVPCVKPLLQSFIFAPPLDNVEKIRIGELYDNQNLYQEGLNDLRPNDFRDLSSDPYYQALSYGTKKKLFHKCLELHSLWC